MTKPIHAGQTPQYVINQQNGMILALMKTVNEMREEIRELKRR